MPLPASLPPNHACSTAPARSIHGIATGVPLCTTTAVFGFAASTAATRSSVPGGSAIVVLSNPSDSHSPLSPVQTTTWSALLAASTASRIAAAGSSLGHPLNRTPPWPKSTVPDAFSFVVAEHPNRTSTRYDRPASSLLLPTSSTPLVLHVGHDELAVDVQLARAVHRQPKVPLARPLGHEDALRLGPPHGRELGVLVVDEPDVGVVQHPLLERAPSVRRPLRGPGRRVVVDPQHEALVLAVGRRQRLAEQRQGLVAVRALGEEDLAVAVVVAVATTTADEGPDALERRDGAVGPEPRAAAAAVGGDVGVGPDDGDGLGAVERQDAALVLQEDERLGGGLAQEGGVRGRVGLGLGRVGRDRRVLEAVLDQPEDVAHGGVELRDLDLVGHDGVRQGAGAPPARPGHLEVEAGLDGLGGADVLQDRLALGRVDAVDLVVRRHDGPRPAHLDGDHEGQQVDLAHRPVRHERVDRHALALEVVADEVLQRRRHPRLLHAPDVVPGEDARQHGVLRVRLEAAPAEGPALRVDGRPEQDVGTLGVRLVRQQLAEAVDEVDVKGRADGRPAREARRGCAVEEAGASHAVGPSESRMGLIPSRSIVAVCHQFTPGFFCVRDVFLKGRLVARDIPARLKDSKESEG
ncbi:hypothetical protein ColKHC_00841 [Colletotrichum higginsianum]|nr:hypothetical protein ColKHC_00841 [Colletotrichum higginsianum]